MKIRKDSKPAKSDNVETAISLRRGRQGKTERPFGVLFLSRGPGRPVRVLSVRQFRLTQKKTKRKIARVCRHSHTVSVPSAG